MCKFFIPPGHNNPHPCHMGMMGVGTMNGRREVVAGRISSMGLCVFFKELN